MSLPRSGAPTDNRIDHSLVSVVRNDQGVALERRLLWFWPIIYAVHIGDGIRYARLSAKRRTSTRSSSLTDQVPHTAFTNSLNENRPEEGCTSKTLRWCRNLGCLVVALQLVASLACALGPVSLTTAAFSLVGVAAIALLQWVVFLLTTPAVVVFYDLNESTKRLWDDASEALDALPQPVQAGVAEPTWDIKRNAGCDHKYTLLKAEHRIDPPPFHTNTMGPVWNTHRAAVMLLPDGVHRFDAEQTRVYPWTLVDFEVKHHQVPHETPPEPAPPKIRTGWLYSNKDGTPDLRHGSNLEVGIYAYTGLRLKDEDGELDEVLLCPDGEALRKLRAALVAYRRDATGQNSA